MGYTDDYCDVEVPDADDLGCAHPDETYDCEWCGESFSGHEMVEDDDGCLVCKDCWENIVCGPSDYDERMEERRQMGLVGF